MGNKNSGKHHKYPTIEEFCKITDISYPTMCRYIKALRSALPYLPQSEKSFKISDLEKHQREIMKKFKDLENA